MKYGIDTRCQHLADDNKDEIYGADLEAFRQFMQEQAGKRKQQEEEFKGYDLGGI